MLSSGDATAIAVSPDGRVLAVGYTSGDIDLADVGTYRRQHRLHVNGAVRAIAFSDDGARLAAVGGSRRLHVWDPRSGAEALATVPSFAGAGTSMQWRPGTHTAVYGGDDGQVTLYDTDTAVQRGVSLPVFADAGAGYVQIAPVAGGRLALFPGWRPAALDPVPARAASLQPSADRYRSSRADVPGINLSRQCQLRPATAR